MQFEQFGKTTQQIIKQFTNCSSNIKSLELFTFMLNNADFFMENEYESAVNLAESKNYWKDLK